MAIDGIVIKSKTRNFIISQLYGFDEFQNDDNLVDMGIVTDDFVFNLIQFIKNEFNITISGEDFNIKKFSINNISRYIEQNKKKRQHRLRTSKNIDGIKEVISTAR